MSVDWISSRQVSESERHIAVVEQPYLDKILNGVKTIESRLSRRAVAPFEAVSPSDTILLKVKSGPIIGRATVAAVCFLRVLDVQSLVADLQPLEKELQLEPAFLRVKRDARFCTLIRLAGVRRVFPFPIPKQDRRGWVVVRNPRSEDKSAASIEFNNNLTMSSAERRRRNTLAAARDVVTTPAPLLLEDASPETVSRVFRTLRSNPWREQWWNRPLDPEAGASTACEASVLRRRVVARLKTSLNTLREFNGTIQQFRDGYQTPYTGNILFYAQHGLALCCRRCVKDWYGIPTSSHLSDAELLAMAGLLMSFVSLRVDGLPI